MYSVIYGGNGRIKKHHQEVTKTETEMQVPTSQRANEWTEKVYPIISSFHEVVDLGLHYQYQC